MKSFSIINVIFLILISTGCAHSQDIRKRLDSYVNAFAEQEKFSGSVLVAKDSEVLLNKGYGKANYELDIPNNPQTKFRIASITKQFTAMAIMQLQEKGLLSVEDKLSKYIPNYPNGEAISIHHLLTHRSGIPDYCSLCNFKEEKVQSHTLEHLIGLFKEKPLDFQPGTQYRYSNSGYVLLSDIIEKISGKEYGLFLKENIFDVLSMNDSGYDISSAILKNRASGYKFADNVLINSEYVDMSFVSGAGGLYSSIEDLYKWDQALHSERLLSEKSLTSIFTPYYSKEADSDSSSWGYGYGWNIHELHDRKLASHLGGVEGFSTIIHRYLDDKICIVILGNIENLDRFRIAKGLAAITLGKEYQLPIKNNAITLDPAIYDKYIGKYKFDDGFTLQIIKNDNRLFSSDGRQPPVELFPKSENDFFYKMSEVQISFIEEKLGRTTKLVLSDQNENLAKRVDK